MPRAARAYVPPPIEGYVTDTAAKLSPDEKQLLAEKLARYRTCSGNHVVVFVTKSLGGESVEDVAYGTFNRWKIGDAKKDNGVLLVVAPNDRKVRIETGKDVGGALTDIESSHILRDHVTPNLKSEHFFAAIDEGTRLSIGPGSSSTTARIVLIGFVSRLQLSTIGGIGALRTWSWKTSVRA